jgi:hypothetical protein
LAKKSPSFKLGRGFYLVKAYLLEHLIQDGTSLVKRKDRRDETEHTFKVGKLAIRIESYKW